MADEQAGEPSRATGSAALRSGLRQLALGGLAVAVTFGIGHLIGAHGG